MADRAAERLIDLSHVIEEGMTTYKGLPGDVGPGDTVLIDDGKVALTVKSVDGPRVRTEVVESLQ